MLGSAHDGAGRTPAQVPHRLIEGEDPDHHPRPPWLNDQPFTAPERAHCIYMLVPCMRKAMPPLLAQPRHEAHEPLHCRGRNRGTVLVYVDSQRRRGVLAAPRCQCTAALRPRRQHMHAAPPDRLLHRTDRQSCECRPGHRRFAPGRASPACQPRATRRAAVQAGGWPSPAHPSAPPHLHLAPTEGSVQAPR
ncbi:hypothetical protein D3C71_1427320 [compost metagenome]